MASVPSKGVIARQTPGVSLLYPPIVLNISEPNRSDGGNAMKQATYTLSAIIGVLASTSAQAYPSMRPYSSGSSLTVYVSNSEDRAYNCTINYAWAYDSFGETKTG